MVWFQVKQKFSDKVVGCDMEFKGGGVQFEVVGPALGNINCMWAVSYLGSLELTWP